MKPVRVDDNLMDKGRLFQTMGPETEKALCPNLVPEPVVLPLPSSTSWYWSKAVML